MYYTSSDSFAAASDLDSYVTTSSFNSFTSSYNTGSFTGSFIGALTGTASFAISASWAPSIATNTGSLLTTGQSNTGLGAFTLYKNTTINSSASFSTPNMILSASIEGLAGNSYFITSGSTTTFYTGGTAGTGGAGGGGNAGANGTDNNGSAGTANTGGGGGSASYNTTGTGVGGSGGSGIVIVRYV
jgi:hypothetical protein